MERPRFSEMLVQRRRELGLSVQQAARVLKLKEEALIAFEEGDFPNIPKSGYAQGMLSSYARYLGLNPREVVDQFQSDLFENTNGMSSHELRRRTRESRGSSAEDTGGWSARNPLGRPRTTYPEYRSLLQNPNSPLGSTDYFDTTSQARSRGSWQNGAYQTARNDGTLDEWEHPYPSSRTTRSRNAAVQQRALSRGQSRPRARIEDSEVTSRGRQTIVHRDFDPDQYTDDLLLDEMARPYEAASTQTGRRASRSINDAPQRPNVRRRTAQSGRRDPRNRNVPKRSGISGMIEDFFSDPRRAAVVILGLLAVLLVLVIATSVRSCASSAFPDDTHDVTVAGAEGTQESTSGNEGEGAGDGTTGDAATDASASTSQGGTQENASTEVNVSVKVADGEVTWVEITKDGSSLVAETVTGPWEESYQVEKQITIQVGDTSVVTVTQNGQLVRLEERASGVGSVTIKGPHYGEEEPPVSGEGEGESEGEDSGEGSGEQSEGESASIYGPDAGYYDENGVWQEGYADDWP